MRLIDLPITLREAAVKNQIAQGHKRDVYKCLEIRKYSSEWWEQVLLKAYSKHENRGILLSYARKRAEELINYCLDKYLDALLREDEKPLNTD